MDTFKDEYGKTLFNSFVLRRDEFAMERLLNAGADVNHVYRVSTELATMNESSTVLKHKRKVKLKEQERLDCHS